MDDHVTFVVQTAFFSWKLRVLMSLCSWRYKRYIVITLYFVLHVVYPSSVVIDGDVLHNVLKTDVCC